MEYARHDGTKTGNAIGRPKRIFDRSGVVRLRDGGLAIEKIARQMGVGVGTVARVIQSRQAEPATFPKPLRIGSAIDARFKTVPAGYQTFPQPSSFGML